MDEQTRTVAISKSDVKSHFQKLSASKQTLDDMRMKNATMWEAFEEAGGNKAAMKHAMKMAKQDAAKTADWQHHFEFYKDVLGLNAQLDALEDVGQPDVIEGESQEVAEATA